LACNGRYRKPTVVSEIDEYSELILVETDLEGLGAIVASSHSYVRALGRVQVGLRSFGRCTLGSEEVLQLVHGISDLMDIAFNVLHCTTFLPPSDFNGVCPQPGRWSVHTFKHEGNPVLVRAKEHMMSTTIDTPMEGGILTIDQAAAYLAIPKATLYTWRTRRAGFGPRAVKLGGCLRYRRSDLDAWVADHVESLDDALAVPEQGASDGLSLSRASRPR